MVFQALFGEKGSEKILGGLLSNILGQKVENISLESNQNLAGEIPEQKRGILDLRAKIGKDTNVNIEVQMVDPHNMFKRMLWYWSRIYGIQIKSGESYSKLKKTISILIANYDIEELDYFEDAHTLWQMLEKRNQEIKIFEDIEIHILEMPKIKKYKKATEKGLNEWLEFLYNPESEEAKMGKKNNEELQEAYKRLEYISQDEELRRKADRELMAILDENSRMEGSREEGIKKGREEGEKIGILKIAKKMKAKGMKIEEIIELTGLTKEEIE